MRVARLSLACAALFGLALPQALPLSAQSVANTEPSELSAFGRAVVVAGEEVLVGEPGNVTRPGLVYVYGRGAEGWVERAQLRSEDAFDGDGFGAALARNGDRLLVGATAQNDEKGAAYVFERQADGTWTEAARLVADDAVAGGNFGAAVALSGETALVGAAGGDESPGAAYVFQRDASGSWTLQTRLAPTDTAVEDRFGAAVAVLGDRAFVSAPGRSENRGIVFEYRLQAGQWSETGELSINELPEDAAFGAALLLREDELLVGAPGPRRSGVGAVYSFRTDPDGGGWQLASRLLPFGATQSDGFGVDLAYGDELFVGSPGTNGGLGAAFAFGRSEDGLWERASRLLIPDAPRRAQLGSAVATDGDIAAFGMIGADYRAGRVAIFERDPTTRAWRLASTVASEADAIPSITGGEVRCEDGKAARFDCQDVDLLAFLSVQDIGGARGANMNDVWGWTDPETGREYVIAGRVDGTSFVDITDPVNPIYLGNLRRTEGSPGTSWRDMKVYENHVFIVSDAAGEHGVQVFDLTKLRDVQAEPIEFEMDAHYTEISSAHNIVINEESGFAFSVGSSSGGESCGGGLHIIDVRDPKNPTFAGCFSDPQTGRAGTGYTHDAQCVIYNGPDTRYSGNEICFNANETALSIADVTDKSATKALSRAAYPNVGYAHQGWLDDEQRYFYMNDELDEVQGSVSKTRTLIWDVSDLEDPRMVGEFLSDLPSSDHNLYVRGDLMYQSNYMAGLRIIDISDRENLREVASFDTAPFNEPQPGFAGSWSNYPFFESGVIAVTSMGEGLFLVKKRDTRPVSN